MIEFLPWILGGVLLALIAAYGLSFVWDNTFLRTARRPLAWAIAGAGAILAFFLGKGSSESSADDTVEEPIEPETLNDEEFHELDTRADDTDLDASSTRRTYDELGDRIADRDVELDRLRAEQEKL